MAKQGADVKIYLKEVRLYTKQRSREGLDALALQVEAHTKANIVGNNQVDTGFMLNSTYSVLSTGSGHGAAQSAAQNSDPEQIMAPPVMIDDGAAVAVGAYYAVYQEARQSFLVKAAEQAAAETDATLEKVWKDAQ
jgi:hypothetical protein